MKRPPLKRPPLGRLTWLARILLLIIILAVVAIFARGWIRHSALAWYGTRVSASAVRDTYNQSFTAFNQQLKTDGVVLNQFDAVNLPCSTVSYHGVHVTVRCKRSRGYTASLPKAAITNWPATYRTLTTHLTGGKWQVDPDSNVTAATLLVPQIHAKGVPQNYLRLNAQQGKVQCHVDIYADNPQFTHAAQSILMFEACGRDINVLGGWQCNYEHDYCRPKDS